MRLFKYADFYAYWKLAYQARSSQDLPPQKQKEVAVMIEPRVISKHDEQFVTLRFVYDARNLLAEITNNQYSLPKAKCLELIRQADKIIDETPDVGFGLELPHE